MTRIYWDQNGKRVEVPTNNGHKGHGRRRRFKREYMRKRQRPQKKGGKNK